MRIGVSRNWKVDMKPELHRLARWLWRWGPALVLMAGIFLASSRNKASIPDFGAWDWPVKKSGHFLVYGLLGLAYFRGLAAGRPAAPRWRLALLAVGMVAAYGATDEVHQVFVPGRGAHATDVLIDSLGAAAALAAWLCLSAWSRGAQPTAGRAPR